MYEVMAKLVNKRFYASATIVQDKLDVFFAVGRIGSDQYVELLALVNEAYGA